ncbi:hypothetical protein D3C76_1334290 [compost metagenome]
MKLGGFFMNPGQQSGGIKPVGQGKGQPVAAGTAEQTAYRRGGGSPGGDSLSPVHLQPLIPACARMPEAGDVLYRMRPEQPEHRRRFGLFPGLCLLDMKMRRVKPVLQGFTLQHGFKTIQFTY